MATATFVFVLICGLALLTACVSSAPANNNVGGGGGGGGGCGAATVATVDRCAAPILAGMYHLEDGCRLMRRLMDECVVLIRDCDPEEYAMAHKFFADHVSCQTY